MSSYYSGTTTPSSITGGAASSVGSAAAGGSSAGGSKGPLSRAVKRSVVPKPTSTFLYENVYRMTIPRLPNDMVLMRYPLPLQVCYSGYKATKVDTERTRPMIPVDNTMGIRLNLINLDQYTAYNAKTQINHADLALISQEDKGHRLKLGGASGAGTRVGGPGGAAAAAGGTMMLNSEPSSGTAGAAAVMASSRQMTQAGIGIGGTIGAGPAGAGGAGAGAGSNTSAVDTVSAIAQQQAPQYGQYAKLKIASAPWMRRTGYDEYAESIIKKKEEKTRKVVVKSRKQRIAEINQQFEAAKRQNYKHPDPKKANLKPVSIRPVFPNFKAWANRYIVLQFSSDPVHNIRMYLEDEPREAEEKKSPKRKRDGDDDDNKSDLGLDNEGRDDENKQKKEREKGSMDLSDSDQDKNKKSTESDQGKGSKRDSDSDQDSLLDNRKPSKPTHDKMKKGRPIDFEKRGLPNPMDLAVTVGFTSKDDNQQLLGYYLPTMETIHAQASASTSKKKKELKYQLLREYTYKMLKRNDEESDIATTFLFSMGNNQLTYAPIQSKMIVNKKINANRTARKNLIISTRPMEEEEEQKYDNAVQDLVGTRGKHSLRKDDMVKALEMDGDDSQ